VTEPAETAPGEVRFKLVGIGGAALIIPVHVNGEGPFNFVLDTGATITCVDQALAEQLKLPQKRGQIGVGATIRGTGRVELVGIETLQVGTAKASDLTACALDLQPVKALGADIQGLVGLNFLKSYRVTLDFERSVVLLQEPGPENQRDASAN
jgi:predicted aspartyl protease